MKRFSPQSKLVIFFSFLAALMIAIVVIYTFSETKKSIEKQLINDLTAIAEATEGHVFAFFDKSKSRIADWSSDAYIRTQSEAILESGDSKKAKELSEYIRVRKHVLDPTVVITDIFNLEGKVIASTEEKRIGYSESEEELERKYGFIRAKNALFGRAFVSGVISEKEDRDGLSDVPMWHASSPLVSLESGKVIGVIVNHILTKEIDEILSGIWQVEQGALSGQEFILRNKTAEIYLVNKDKLMITPSRFIKESILKQKIENKIVNKCLENKEEFSGVYSNYLGKEVMGAAMCLPGYDMALLVEIEKSEILSFLPEIIGKIVLVSAIVWLLSVLIVFIFSRRFAKEYIFKM